MDRALSAIDQSQPRIRFPVSPWTTRPRALSFRPISRAHVLVARRRGRRKPVGDRLGSPNGTRHSGRCARRADARWSGRRQLRWLRAAQAHLRAGRSPHLETGRRHVGGHQDALLARSVQKWSSPGSVPTAAQPVSRGGQVTIQTSTDPIGTPIFASRSGTSR